MIQQAPAVQANPMIQQVPAVQANPMMTQPPAPMMVKRGMGNFTKFVLGLNVILFILLIVGIVVYRKATTEKGKKAGDILMIVSGSLLGVELLLFIISNPSAAQSLFTGCFLCALSGGGGN
jgi:hypothetical protein